MAQFSRTLPIAFILVWQAAAEDLILTPQAHCRDAGGSVKNCELGDTLYVGFANLRAWMDSDQGKNAARDLVLVLDGRVIKGLTPRGPDTQFKELAFDLKRLDGDHPDSQQNREAWNALFSRSKGNRTVSVSLAAGGNPPYFGPASVTFQVFPSYSWLVIAFLLGLALAVAVLAWRSDILRDGPSADGEPKRSFSLARCQMAWWFFLTVAAYHYIWMVTGDRDSLTPGALILIAISAATGLGAVVVDTSKRNERQSLEAERTALNGHLGTIATGLTGPDAGDWALQQKVAVARLSQVNSTLGNLPSTPGASQGFLVDILRDETGVSFHRFQMAAWTIVLGFVFVIAVYRTLAMPDFSATLLGLMGVSAGTYLGFKIPDAPK